LNFVFLTVWNNY